MIKYKHLDLKLKVIIQPYSTLPTLPSVTYPKKLHFNQKYLSLNLNLLPIFIMLLLFGSLLYYFESYSSFQTKIIPFSFCETTSDHFTSLASPSPQISFALLFLHLAHGCSLFNLQDSFIPSSTSRPPYRMAFSLRISSALKSSIIYLFLLSTQEYCATSFLSLFHYSNFFFFSKNIPMSSSSVSLSLQHFSTDPKRISHLFLPK